MTNVILDQYLAVSYNACRQLQVWREKEYNPQVWGMKDGWVVILSNVDFAYGPFGEQPDMALRYKTGPCLSIEAAVEAALKVIQP